MLAYFEDLFAIIFPNNCNACGKALYKHEELICNYCKAHLPYTNFHTIIDNPVEKVFWGRVQFQTAATLLYFHKGSRVQSLMHRFKYKGKKEIGHYLGLIYGEVLKRDAVLNNAELIIPVPLHPEKLRKRGYNQSLWFAKGLAQVLQIPVEEENLVRVVASLTQTRKSRYERWENVESIFEVKHPERLQNKHLILVDDVITTGATIEACAQTLLKAASCKISCLALAYAHK